MPFCSWITCEKITKATQNIFKEIFSILVQRVIKILSITGKKKRKNQRKVKYNYLLTVLHIVQTN